MKIMAALCIAIAANTACQKTSEASPKETDSKDAQQTGVVSEKSQQDTLDTLPQPLIDEQELSQKFKKIFDDQATILNSLPRDDYEKREKGYALLCKEEAKFIEVLRQNPKTLDYPEEKMAQLLGDRYIIVTSPDGRVRTYSWDTFRGGTGSNTASITQFRSKTGKTYITCEYERSAEEDLYDYEIQIEKDKLSKKKSKNEEYDSDIPWEWKSEVKKIYQMDTSNGRIYLAFGKSINSRLSGRQEFESLAITGEKMTRIPIFIIDGKKRADLSCEAFGEDISSDKFLTFDKTNNIISFYDYEDENPIASGNCKRKDKITYKYDGKMFKLVK